MSLGLPWLLGGGALVGLWGILGLVTGWWKPWMWSLGEDGRPSTSKLQAQLWTVVVLYTYLVLGAARLLDGDTDVVVGVPQNLLLAMGMAIGTGVAAAQIRATQSARIAAEPTRTVLLVGGAESAPPALPVLATPRASELPAGYDARFLVLADNEAPDLAKTQLLAWTFVSIAAHVLSTIPAVLVVVDGGPAKLPDIDATLMLLMGIGQAGYLGQKVVESTRTGR